MVILKWLQMKNTDWKKNKEKEEEKKKNKNSNGNQFGLISLELERKWNFLIKIHIGRQEKRYNGLRKC